MNCNHLFLIVFTLILIIEASYDYLSEKTKKLPKREKFKFLPEKGGQRFFLYFIYLFPLIITVISPVKNEFNISDSIKEYMSFYATALTITYTVYTFNKQQEKFLEEKQKENEIKEKELEAKRDYYRPVFVIETDQHNNKSVKLLMKDKYLYLEKINYLTLKSDSAKYKSECKHGEIIIPQITNTFFMTAETLIGEIIFFGYIDGKKIYKYLKTNQIPFPTEQEVYNKDEYDKIWSSFNTFNTEGDLYLEPLLFEYSFFLRLYLYYDINRFLPNSLQTNTLKDFFDNIFKDLSAYLINNNNNTIHKSNNIYKILDLFTKELDNHKHSLRIDFENREPFRSLINTAKLVTDDYSKIINDNNNTLENSYIINIIMNQFSSDYLNNYKSKFPSSPGQCLEYFERLFGYIEFDSSLDKELHLFVEIALTHLN